MQQSLDAARWVYNKTLEIRKEAWDQRQESLGLYDTHNLLTSWKKENTFLTDAYSQVLYDAQKRVDLAFSAFFRRVKTGQEPGYPRFRSATRYDSFTYPQFGFKVNGNRLRLSKIGEVKIVLHRPIEGKIKTCTIRRTATGDWYACFSCVVETEPLPVVEQVVGIDVGITSFATFSTGEKIANPRFFRSEEKTLARAKRRLAKAEKGTSLRAKRRQVVARVHERIANRRKDFAHKLSRRLVNEFQVIAFEDLDIKNMQKGNWRSLNKSISDAAWGQLIQYTEHKAEWAGRSVVKVNPRNTSKMCSRCGQIVEKDLSVRVHKCPHCGLVLDRDENAAINILRLAVGLHGPGIQSLEAHGP